MYKSQRHQLGQIRSALLGSILREISLNPKNAAEKIAHLTQRYALFDVSSKSPSEYRALRWGFEMFRKDESESDRNVPFHQVRDDRSYWDNVVADWDESIRTRTTTGFVVTARIIDRIYSYERICFPIIHSHRVDTLLVLSDIIKVVPAEPVKCALAASRDFPPNRMS